MAPQVLAAAACKVSTLNDCDKHKASNTVRDGIVRKHYFGLMIRSWLDLLKRPRRLRSASFWDFSAHRVSMIETAVFKCSAADGLGTKLLVSHYSQPCSLYC